MKKLLAQKTVSSEELQQLLAAVKVKANPTISFDTEALSKHLTPMLIANIPALDATAVATQLGPLLAQGLPTPATLRQAGDETVAKLNQAFSRQEQRMQVYIDKLGGWMTAIEQRVEKLMSSMPRTVGLDVFRDKRVFLIVFSVPMVCILALLFHSLVMRVSKEQYERLQAQRTLLQERSTLLQDRSDRMTDASMFYVLQIKNYQKKFPKNASYFPAFKPKLHVKPAEK